MSNVLSTGSKFHLMAYKGVSKNDKGVVYLAMGQHTRQSKACGGRYKATQNAQRFTEDMKSFPESACKKCAAKLKELLSEAKKLNEQN